MSRNSTSAPESFVRDTSKGLVVVTRYRVGGKVHTRQRPMTRLERIDWWLRAKVPRRPA